MAGDVQTPSPVKGAEARLVEIVFPGLANHHGTLFAGNALSFMAKAAFAAASRQAGTSSVVLASCERIDLRHPVPIGAVIEYRAAVVRIGRSSMTVEVEGWIDPSAAPKAKPDAAKPGAAMRGRFEMVAVDESGRACPMIKPSLNKESAT